MTLPSNITKDHLDQSSDDPKQARAELVAAIDAINALINHLGLSVVTSNPLGLGSNLYNNGGNIDVRIASLTQRGIAELSTDAEALAKSDAGRVLTPKNLAALAASTSVAGLLELATNAEALAGTSASLGISAAALKHVLDNRTNGYPEIFTSSGTWNKPDGVSKVQVTVIAAGGGGGAGHPDGTVSGHNGSGGGAGSACIAIIDVSSISSVPVTVGVKGNGGSWTNNSGSPYIEATAGGASSFGSYVTCGGGEKGVQLGFGIPVGGAGGIVTTAGVEHLINFRNGGNGGNGSSHSSYVDIYLPNGEPVASFGGIQTLTAHIPSNPDHYKNPENTGQIHGLDAEFIAWGGQGGDSNHAHWAAYGGDGGDGLVIVEPIG